MGTFLVADRSLRRVPLARVLNCSENPSSQKDYCSDSDPVGGYVHQMGGPNQPSEHDQEPDRINRKRH